METLRKDSRGPAYRGERKAQSILRVEGGFSAAGGRDFPAVAPFKVAAAS